MIKINKKECDGCGNCIEVCPFDVLELKNGKVIIKNPENCRGCGACISACPNKVIETKEEEK